MGFDDVFDTNWAADLTIMEEGTEFLERITKAFKGEEAVLPMITSCSPGWVKYVEHAFPKELDHLSTCKSPHTMFGASCKVLLCAEDQCRSEGHLRCLRHALHGEEIRDRPS